MNEPLNYQEPFIGERERMYALQWRNTEKMNLVRHTGNGKMETFFYVGLLFRSQVNLVKNRPLKVKEKAKWKVILDNLSASGSR